MSPTPFQLPDEEPEHYRRRREALRRPGIQFSLRTLFIATAVLALLSVGLKWLSGGTVLDLLPLVGALVLALGAIWMAHAWVRCNEVTIGATAMIGGLTFLGLASLWVQESYDHKVGAARVAWERVRLGDMSEPFLSWLLAFGIAGVLGALGGGVVALRNWAYKRRQATVPIPGRKDYRFQQAYHSAIGVLDSWSISVATILAVSGLLCLAALWQADWPQQIDMACWMTAIWSSSVMLAIVMRWTRQPAWLVTGGIAIFVAAVLSMLSLWTYDGALPQPMLGYAQRAKEIGLENTHVLIVTKTLAGWLLWFGSAGMIGVAVGALLTFIPWPRRRSTHQKLLPAQIEKSISAYEFPEE